MGKSAINANVAHFVEADKAERFREQVKDRAVATYGNLVTMAGVVQQATGTVYRRLSDPDRFTVGELRELRYALKMDKNGFIEWLRPLL